MNPAFYVALYLLDMNLVLFKALQLKYLPNATCSNYVPTKFSLEWIIT